MKRIACYRITALTIFILLVPAMIATAEGPLDESWLDDDSEWRALQVNEGQLEFIPPSHDQPILHSDSELWITSESLQTGSVKLQQCFRHLDAVGRTEVVYAYREMVNLQVTRVEKIARFRVKRNGVELENVEKGAVLCVQADVKILERLSDRTYSLKNGPYHRKFLDGYYPYHVSLKVHYSKNGFRLARVMPEAQEGFNVTETEGGLSIDSWFAGVLQIELEFLEL